MRIITVNKNDAGQRLDKFLTKAIKALPQSFMYKAIRTKKIKVNRKRASPEYMLCEHDTIELFIKEDFFDEETAELSFMHLTPRLDIIYEDDDIIICDKPPSLICHPDDDEKTNTLIAHIKAYLYRKGEYNPEAEQSFAPSLCNRIDRNTGGIVVAAKNAAALRRINEKMKNGEIIKKYLCAVHGVMPKETDTVVGYLVKDSDNNMVTVYKDKPNLPGAKKIITKYKVLKIKDNLSLLEIELITGRTHQIRAQLAALGHPLLGDGKYGTNRGDRKIGYKFQALYSYYLEVEGKVFTVLDKEISGKIWFLKEFE